MIQLGDFFSPEAGQARTRWLNDKFQDAYDAAEYYLGPTGIPQRVMAMGHALNFTDAGDMPEAARASRELWNNPSLEAATDYLGAGIALGVPVLSARMINDGVDVLGSAVDDVMAGYDPAVLRSGVGPTAKADPATTRGQEILDLLSTNPSAVTDDMLDMGDPVLNTRLNEYLWNNYDLPMDEASRMTRAEGMGFDVETPLYHGTRHDFSGFDIDAAGATDAGWYGRGVYTSADPELASGYAPYGDFAYEGRVLPVTSRGSQFDIDQSTIMGALDTRDELARIGIAADVPMNTAESHRVGNLLSERGVDNINVNIDMEDLKQRANERVTFNPANIRSRFARFDPRLAHLRNLNAGLAGIMMGGMALSPSDEAELETYLDGI